MSRNGEPLGHGDGSRSTVCVPARAGAAFGQGSGDAAVAAAAAGATAGGAPGAMRIENAKIAKVTNIPEAPGTMPRSHARARLRARSSESDATLVSGSHLIPRKCVHCLQKQQFYW
jgi:hypothetical protein